MGVGIHIGTVVVKADDPETFKRKLKAVAKTKSGQATLWWIDNGEYQVLFTSQKMSSTEWGESP